MVLKIAVCDDDLTVCTQIDIYLQQIQAETGMKFRTFYFSSGEDLLGGMPKDVQVLLLDIQMGQLSGIEAARQLRAGGADFYLFFITSNVQYALEGYEVHAYAFLRKPVQYVPLKRLLEEVAGRLSRAKPFTISLKNIRGTTIIDCADILYFEVYGHEVTVVTPGTRETYQTSLNELEKTLSSQGFFRCHKSYLVNLKKVTSIHADSISMANQDEIPLSRHRKQEFLSAMQEFGM